MYCNHFSNDINWSSTVFNTRKPFFQKVSFPAAIMMHVLHIAYCRLSAVARTGSISCVFQSTWNPVIYEISAHGELVGGVFLNRCSTDVFELEAVILWAEMDDDELSSVVLKFIQISRVAGISKIIMKTSDQRFERALAKVGFNLEVSNSVLSMDLPSVL